MAWWLILHIRDQQRLFVTRNDAQWESATDRATGKPWRVLRVPTHPARVAAGDHGEKSPVAAKFPRRDHRGWTESPNQGRLPVQTNSFLFLTFKKMIF